jgi:sugar transferase (PEP-CTERM system associated)
MIRIFHIHFPAILVAIALADAVLLYAAIDVSIELYRSGPVAFVHDLPGWTVKKAVFLAAVMGGFLVMGVYSRDTLANFRELLVRVGAAMALAFAFLLSAFYVVPSSRIWISAMLPAMAAVPFCVAIDRSLFRPATRAGMFKARVLVLGAGVKACKVEEAERLTPGNHFECAGFLSFNQRVAVDHRRVIGETDLRRVCEILKPHEIVVALDEQRNRLPVEALLACRLRGTNVTALQTFLERETGRIDVDHLDPSWLTFSEGALRGPLWRAAKRLLDIVAGASFLLATLPVLFLVMAAIRLEDGGPVFYSQERVGLHGRHFRILKFRSMRTDAECAGTARWATRRDPRVTCVGAFIRRARLDEVPQMINVLKGEMSFVGPRPERPAMVAEIVHAIPYFDYRHLVKPGITGWAQINHSYTDSVEGAREKLAYDLYYVKNGGLFLDALVMLQTIRVVLWGQGSR